jgi:hypothetical protein
MLILSVGLVLVLSSLLLIVVKEPIPVGQPRRA